MRIRHYLLALFLSLPLVLPNASRLWATADNVEAGSNPFQSVGETVKVTGTADATNKGTARPLADGYDIYQCDIIRTGPASQIQIVMSDGGKLALGAETVFSIDEYGFDPDAGAGRMLLNLVEGAFRAVSGRLNELSDSNFSVFTPRGTIGVRGTEFWGGFMQHEGHTKFGVLMIGGKAVEVSTAHGVAILDEPGEGVWIDAEGKLLKQDKWSKEMVDKAATITGDMP